MFRAIRLQLEELRRLYAETDDELEGVQAAPAGGEGTTTKKV